MERGRQNRRQSKEFSYGIKKSRTLFCNSYICMYYFTLYTKLPYRDGFQLSIKHTKFTNINLPIRVHI